MGWLITLGILVLVGILPLGVNVNYDADGAVIHVIAGPLKIRVFPLPPKEKKPQKDKKTKKSKEPKKHKESKQDKKQKTAKKQKGKSAPQGDAQPEKKKSGGPITDFLPLVGVLLKFLDGFRRKLRVNMLDLKIVMAGGDPCDLALNYGKAWAAVGNLMPQLERVFVIQKRNVDVQCDFTADKTLVNARLDLTITVGRLLGLVFALIGRAVVALIKIVMKRKGGAVNEPKSS